MKGKQKSPARRALYQPFRTCRCRTSAMRSNWSSDVQKRGAHFLLHSSNRARRSWAERCCVSLLAGRSEKKWRLFFFFPPLCRLCNYQPWQHFAQWVCLSNCTHSLAQWHFYGTRRVGGIQCALPLMLITLKSARETHASSQRVGKEERVFALLDVYTVYSLMSCNIFAKHSCLLGVNWLFIAPVISQSI